MRKSKHLARAVLLIVMGLAGFFVMRGFLIPDTWGALGHYRAANLDEQRALEVRHGGRESCLGCHLESHEKNYQANQAGPHKTVHCEACHGPVTWHVDLGTMTKKAEMPRHVTWKLCARCHQKLQARPVNFVQIDVTQHLQDQGAEYSDAACFDCHSPHDPTP